MQNKDGTGPAGKGPRTGRGQGNCADGNKSDDKRPRRGMGLGRRAANKK